jgi:hypothetical protein
VGSTSDPQSGRLAAPSRLREATPIARRQNQPTARTCHCTRRYIQSANRTPTLKRKKEIPHTTALLQLVFDWLLGHPVCSLSHLTPVRASLIPPRSVPLRWTT